MKQNSLSCEGVAPSEAWLFAQAILGNSIPDPRASAERARHDRELLEFAASISDRCRDELRRLRDDEAQSRRSRELLEWLAPMSEKHERELRALQHEEADARDAQRRYERFVESLAVQEAQWDPAKHPRLGGPPNAGWFATTGGSTTTTGANRAPSKSNTDSPPAEQPDELIVTPPMVRSTGWLGTIRERLRLAAEVGTAFVAGLGTGAKAVVNGLATAARSVATLGLNTDQLEVIGVTKQDRERGYDTAVTISTGSGQVLIAVGTGGIASALAKGGTVARAASGALLVFDSAGNAVGVVQGVYDASQNGVTLANGTQVAASALGLTANAQAVRGLQVARKIGPRRQRASLGHAPSTNYRQTFFDAHPDRQGKVIVHHSVEQQVLDRYPGVITETELHSLENLRGIPKGSNAQTHLREIRKEWNAFYRQHPERATKEQLLDKATEIDNKFGHLFDPPIR
jgi:hypothetical protein